MNVYGCIAYPCDDEREEGSAFCAGCKAKHAKSRFKLGVYK